MRPFHAFLTFLLVFFSTRPVAGDPLPAKEVFMPGITQRAENGAFATTVRITMPPGFYLYVDKSDLTAEGVEGALSKSPGVEHEDDYFGKQQVWYGEGALTLTHRDAADTFTLTAQGCEENRLCYPPTTWTLTVEPPAPLATNGLFPQKRQAKNPLMAGDAQVLPQDQAFPVHALSENGQAVVHLDIPEGYYLYRDKFRALADGRELLPLFPEGEWHSDEFFGEQVIYRGTVRIPLPLSPGEGGQSVEVHFQGCADVGVCYPPMTRSLVFGGLQNAPAAQAPENPQALNPAGSNIHPIQRALSDNFWLNLPLVLLLGISVSFTACVYPLIPIVTSLVVGENRTPRQSFALIAVYVLGMAGAMALIGALFALFDLNIQLILQKPLFVAIAALVFVALSLSLFDVYRLQTPVRLQKYVDSITRRQRSGSYTGAAVMGALSVLVVSSCATPVLAALLLFTAQTTVAKSAIALFVFGLGTGVPLFVFASVFRRYMPKAGAWMEGIKRAFAFALLAIALWLVTRILPLFAGLALWAIYGAFAAFMLWPLPASSGRPANLRRFLALLAFIAALALANQAVRQWLEPEHKTQTGQHAAFTRFDDENTLQRLIAQSDKPVIVDIYADWCVSCKVWERDIWHNPDMAERLSHFTLLKVDVTDFTAAHQALFRRLDIIAPPTVLIYPANGASIEPARMIVGEMTAGDFAAELRQWQ